MLTCNAVKDLLPNYIDGLVSDETAQEIAEHLKACSECTTEYEQMKAPVAPLVIQGENEIDYLKIIKKRNRLQTIKVSVLSVVAAAVIFVILSFLFYFGKPINSENFSYTLNRPGAGRIEIDMKLTNGLALNGIPEQAYDPESGNFRYVYEPRQAFKIPFDDRGEDEGGSYSWGLEFYGVDEADAVDDQEIFKGFQFLIRFSDKDVILTIDDFPRDQHDQTFE